MTNSGRNFDDDSFDEVEEDLRKRDPDEEDRAYFPPEESQPPHYWSDMKTHALFLLLLLVLASPALAQSTITIQSCYDGDTCTTTTKEKIRLACFDTPELRSSRADPIPAKAARDYLNDLVAGKEVAIRRITKDRYGRTVAEISLDDINIQERLVEKGLARIYNRYADQCPF